MTLVKAMLRRHRGTLIGFVAQALQYGAGLVLLPFVVTRLSQTEVGLWYVFLTLQGLASLADFGFQPTVARAFASANAGAPHLQMEGLARSSAGVPNLPLMASILRAARRLYLILAGSLFLLLATGGLLYVSMITPVGTVDRDNVRLSWILFSAGTALNIYFLWISSLLVGTGRVSSNYAFLSVSRGGFALIGLICLISGGGLIALAAATLGAALLARLAVSWTVSRATADFVESPDADISWRVIFSNIWPNASRMGLVALGAFFITRFNVLVLSSFAGLEVSSRYAITLQLLLALQALGQLPMQIALPHMISLRVRHQAAELWKVFLQRQRFMVFVFVVGVAMIALVGQRSFDLIGSNVRILPAGLVIAFGFVVLLEANHASCAFVIATDNRIPFVKAALLSGAAVAVLSIGAAWAGWGALGVIVAQGVAQLAYNNWKWPLSLYRDLKDG